MDCKDINELFTAYVDGEVTPDEGEQIQAHLSACIRCREELEALAATQKNLRQALKVTAAGVIPSPQAWAGIRQWLEAEEQPRVTILGLAKSKMKGGIGITIRGLVSRQPVWKTAVIGVLALALIAGLAIALPSLTGQSAEALAADIARNSPEVQAALDGEEVKVIKVIQVVDDKGTVLLLAEIGYVTAEVDLDTKQVTEVVYVHVPELTAADEQKAIEIAKADPRVRELLEQGASISRVLPLYAISVSELLGPDGEILNREGSVELMANVRMKLGEKEWYALIRLAAGKVLNILN